MQINHKQVLQPDDTAGTLTDRHTWPRYLKGRGGISGADDTSLNRVIDIKPSGIEANSRTKSSQIESSNNVKPKTHINVPAREQIVYYNVPSAYPQNWIRMKPLQISHGNEQVSRTSRKRWSSI